MVHIEVYAGEWVNGSGWSYDNTIEYDYDPDCEPRREDLIDFVEDAFADSSAEELEGLADDSISDTRYKMIVYAAHEDEDDDDYYYDEPIAVYKVWLSEVAKKLLKRLRAEKRQLDGLKKD